MRRLFTIRRILVVIGLFLVAVAGIYVDRTWIRPISVANAPPPGPTGAPPTVKLLPNQFEFEGQIWTVVKGFDGHPVGDTTLMTPGFARVCPGLKVDLVQVNRDAGGVKMSPEARFRGDKRNHVECNRKA